MSHHYIGRYSRDFNFEHHSHTKRDTITTNVIPSINGRRLVTSLILVIPTTIILLVLLIVNLNCNIFTEATVNTTLTTSPIPQTTPSSVTTLPPLVGPSFTSTQTPPVSVTTNGGRSEADLVGQSTANSINNTIGGSEQTILAKIKDISLPKTTSKTNNTATDQPMASETSNEATTNSSSPGDSTKPDPCLSLTPDRNNATNGNNEKSKYFDIDYASKTFQDSMVDKDAISLHHYLNGFKELMKFFHSLGTIFLFVTSDLETKIGLLENYRNVEQGGCNPAYLTIQSAIEYETKENLLRDTKRQSGARTILRLHRALEFLSALMLNLSKLNEDEETATAARDAYSGTLARHHPWTIRTIASFAMRTLPLKKILVESVLGKENSGNETATNEKMLALANVTDNLFLVVDKYYEEKQLKDLP